MVHTAVHKLGLGLPLLQERLASAVSSGTQNASGPTPVRGGELRGQCRRVAAGRSDLRTAEILRRVRRAGYREGKSALYELVRRMRNRPAGNRAPAPQQLVLVTRDRRYLYNFFKLVFDGNPTVQVVADRRFVSRRPQAIPEGQERRNRRASQTTDRQLYAIGWTVVRL